MSKHYEDLALAEYKSAYTYHCSFEIKRVANYVIIFINHDFIVRVFILLTNIVKSISIWFSRDTLTSLQMILLYIPLRLQLEYFYLNKNKLIDDFNDYLSNWIK